VYKYLVMSHTEPTVKTMREIAAEALKPLAEAGDLTSANVRYRQFMDQAAEDDRPVRLGRYRR